MYQAKQSQRLTKYTPNQTKYKFDSLNNRIQQMVLKDLYNHLTAVKRLSNHLQRKIHAQRVCIPYKALKAIIKHNQYKVIEVNVTGNEVRYLLRGTTSFYCKLSGTIQRVNLCIVVNTQSQTIITAYLNTVSDNHASLNLKRYAN